MASKDPPNSAKQPSADRAAEDARKWNRELRHAVHTAKAHAKAISENQRPGTAKPPS